MFLSHALKISILLLLFSSEAKFYRVYFSRCGTGGFSCETQNGKYKVTYQCSSVKELDQTLYLWQFRSPSNIESLTIVNCSTLRLSFQCTSENKAITFLKLTNITNLFILKATATHNPQTVIFDNISNLEYIPENTFSQIKRRHPISGCVNPAKDLENLHFNKVNIGSVAPGAFSDLKDFLNFSWNEVNVRLLQHIAVQLEFNKAGNFSIRKSNLEVCEHLAFKITGTRATFVENNFGDMYSAAINGTIGTFTFTINVVSNMQAYAISVLAENVEIIDNRFHYLFAGAFERISPGLMQISHRNFGTLKFVYEFSYNFVNFMSVASFNPDIRAYDNVKTELKVHDNAFMCSCENLGWLFSQSGYGYTTSLLQDFYDTITEEEYNNKCSSTSCDLLLKSAKNLLKDGKCLENKIAENLCEVENANTTAKYVPYLSKGTVRLLPVHYISSVLITTFVFIIM